MRLRAAIGLTLCFASLGSTTPSGQTKTTCEENPFQFPFRFPKEKVLLLNCSGCSDEVNTPPKLALHWFDDSDLLFSPNFTDPLNGSPTDYTESIRKPQSWPTYFQDTSGEHEEEGIIKIKKSYLEEVKKIESRIQSVLWDNLKAALWVDLANLFNSNLEFKKWKLEDRRIITLINPLMDSAHGNKVALTLVRKVTLPEPIPLVEKQYADTLDKTYAYVRFLSAAMLHAHAEEVRTDPGQYVCHTVSGEYDLSAEGKTCLKEKLFDTNHRWHKYEEIIDHIRSKFDAPKRTCSKLYNPVERWM